MYVLGIGQVGGFDSSAVLIKDGEILCAIEEERLSRVKHVGGYPAQAIEHVLGQAGISLKEVEHIAIVDRPLLRFFHRTMVWYLPKLISHPQNALYHILHDEMPAVFDFYKAKRKLLEKSDGRPKVHFVEHHIAHMASAFLVSPFEEAALLTLDAMGEVASTVLGSGRGNEIKKLKEARMPDSLGVFYAAITDFLGFKAGEDEYKVMGLASYGKLEYLQHFRKLIQFNEGSLLKTDLSYFTYQNGRGFFTDKFYRIFGPPRNSREPIEQRHLDLGASAQALLEEIILSLVRHLRELVPVENLCLAGGVALNCVANGKIARGNIFENIYIQPAAGDHGGALGAAFYIYNSVLNQPRNYVMKTANLGTCFSNEEIENMLKVTKVPYRKSDDICRETAEFLAEGKIIGWFQGNMEFGPRALGCRSILADAMDPGMKDKINMYVKFREEFRPFAPSVKSERCSEFFDSRHESPFMLLITDVREEYKAKLPAITHVDGTARVQSVDKNIEPRYWKLLDEFEKIRGLPVLLNTSFNVMGEPIVHTPEQAVRCFFGSGIDVLAMGDFIIEK